jgi:perosamine synthetase
MIPVFQPYVGNEEIEAIAEVIKSRWLGLGPKTAEFEKAFASYIGAEYAIGLNSGTSALDLALKLYGINHGDEVIVPTMTFVSTAHAVVYNLATPIFVDVDPGTLNIDLEDVERKITNRTKAIIAVHYSGRPVDLDKLREIIKGKNIILIEDAAHATGASYKGTKCGALGDIAAFSFHAVKPLCMSDGGAITLNDKDMMERAKRLRWLGIDKGTWDRTSLDRSYWWEYQVDEIGLKCHMNDIQAAMGLVQLKKLDEGTFLRREAAKLYSKLLFEIDEIELPLCDNDIFQSSWHIYCIKCEKRDELSLYLKDKGISTGVHYKPIHLYSCYGNKTYLPKAEKVFKKILTLPLFPELKMEETEFIVKNIKEFYEKNIS